MCGIAGEYNLGSGKLVNEQALISVRDYMQSRGPDDAGSWLSEDRRVGLAHRRLSIIDTSSAGHQPMFSADGSVAIVFNGEIYNFAQIRASLESKYNFRSNSDTEAIVYLYQEYGVKLFSHLRGMYAFAIWDLEKQKLLLGRDPFGIKPLYYSWQDDTFRFASQVRAFKQFSDFSAKLDQQAACAYFLLGSIPEPLTIVSEIKQVPAGCYLEIEESLPPRVSQHYSLADTFRNPSERQKGVALADVLQQSVSAHLLSDVPIGFFLSAGLDSTTLVGLAAQNASNDIHTVTLGFDVLKGSLGDETELASRVAKTYGTKHSSRWITASDFGRLRKDLFSSMDQPSIDGINTYFVSKIARDSGLTVALSGLGGDEIFGGYQSFKQAPKLYNSLGGLPLANSLGVFSRKLLYPVLKQITSPKYAGLLEYSSSLAAAYFLRRALYMPWELEEFIDPGIVEQSLIELDLIGQMNRQIKDLPNDFSAISLLELSWYMKNQLLRDSDWASMAHSLEIRVPLVDVEVLAAIASQAQSHTHYNKQDMVSTLKLAPPPEIVNRDKTGFVVPVREWLMAEESSSFYERGLRGWSKLVFGTYCDEMEIDHSGFLIG